MKKYIVLLFLSVLSMQAFAQVDRHDVRAGNRKFKKNDYKNAEIDYRKAVVKDSMSVAGQYNLANDLYRQQDYDGAGKALETIKPVATSADYHYNAGDIALQKKDYAAAVEAFKQSLLVNPGDLDAKENYIYAKKMLQNQQGGGGGGNNNQDQQNNDQNQDQQNNDQNQDQNQDNNNDQQQNNDQNQQDQQDQQDQQQQQQPQEQKISQQQAQQMLRAIQAKEAETQDKVNKEKAALLKSKQKEKNW